jgi:hypothetical protein
MPRCSVCNKYSFWGFVPGTTKPVHTACLKKDVVRRVYTVNPLPRSTRRDEDDSPGFVDLALLNAVLSYSHDSDNHHESTPEPFEGKGGEFGGAGATGSWEPSESNNDSPPSDDSPSSDSSSSDSSSSSGD